MSDVRCQKQNGFGGVDAAVFGLAFMLGLFGLLTIISSQSGERGPTMLALLQLRNFLIGLAVLAVAARLDFSFYRRYAAVLAVLSLIPLVLLLFWGVRINGMCGWFRFGGVTLQPSELAKPLYLLALVRIFTGPGSAFRRGGLVVLAALAWLVPVGLQPDMGTAAVYAALAVTVLFLGGIPVRVVGGVLVAAAVAAAGFVLTHPYAMRRLTGFLDPESDPLGSGWHVRQFELAIARGQIFGSKLGNALWSNAYLPLPYNDSAFATLMETLGLAGGTVVVLLFVFLVAVPSRAALIRPLPDDARLFAMGAVALLALQTLVHVSVNLCLLPPTGLTLPLISYGGSSFAGCGLLLGMMLSALKAVSHQAPPDENGTSQPG